MGNRSRCILLVDDEEVVLDVGTMMLEKVGYQVLGARNSAEAVEIFKQNGKRSIWFCWTSNFRIKVVQIPSIKYGRLIQMPE